jgi:polyisoprenoid-binding protein YceI
MSNWNIDTTHSTISFSVRHMVVAKVRGSFKDWSGTLTFDPEHPERSSVEAEIAATSIDTGVADRDNHLRSADFFDVETFPTMRFTSDRVEKVGERSLRVIGDLTIRDITREVALDVEFAGKAVDPWGNDRVAFSASTAIDRTDFGLKWNQALEAGGVLVGERVSIEFDVQAVAATEAESASA